MDKSDKTRVIWYTGNRVRITGKVDIIVVRQTLSVLSLLSETSNLY